MNTLLSQPTFSAYTIQDVFDLVENSERKYLEIQTLDTGPHIRAITKRSVDDMEEKSKKLSKLLSFVLRHGALDLGLDMGTDGYTIS